MVASWDMGAVRLTERCRLRQTLLKEDDKTAQQAGSITQGLGQVGRDNLGHDAVEVGKGVEAGKIAVVGL